MDYAEFAPEPRLAPFVHCVWTFRAAAPGEAPQRIVPDGRPELVLHGAAPFAEIDGEGASVPQPWALFAGQVTRPLRLRARGEADVIGVRFRPAGARCFLGAPLRTATDRRLDLEALWPLACAALAADTAAGQPLPARLGAVQDFVHARITAGSAARDATVEACVARIEACAGELDIEMLGSDSGLSRRQLERRFANAVGVGPALLAAIFRFRRAFDVLEHDARRPWTEAALAAGFYDQSHFIREFRRFVGCTPTEFVAEARGLAHALAQPRGDVASVQAPGGSGR